MRPFLAALVLLLLPPAALAQASASFRVEASELNAGGRPDDGQTAASASFRISLDNLGGFAPTRMTSASLSSDAGLLPVFAPPGEVLDLRLSANDLLDWAGAPAAAAYNLYRGDLAVISGLGFGECEQTSIAASETTDATVPAAGAGFFYLVTAVNRLGEEGPKGFSGDGSPRSGTVCP